MIPKAFIIEWSQSVPWQTEEQVEQDLVICRTLHAIFSDKFLMDNLAFRGGTALHKLYLQPQSRYSEDIDLVQMQAGPFGPIMDRLKERLQFLGEPRRLQKKHNNTLVYRFESEFQPDIVLKLKIETNCREHFAVLGWQQAPFQIDNSWYRGTCHLTTYRLEELLGTKLRALYQRRKGRDLYDIYKAFTRNSGLNRNKVLECYAAYMKFSVDQPPSSKLFLQNMDNKMQDDEFLGDITALIRPEETYDPLEAYKIVQTELIEKI